MNPTQQRIYRELNTEYGFELDGRDYEVTKPIEASLRLQQITGGHYPFDDGEKIVAKRIPGVNPKIKELLNVLEEHQGKVIVWCRFRPEIDLVAEHLRKKGIKYVEYHGGKDRLEKRAAYDEFRANPDYKVFLASRAASRGLTLTVAHLAVYYSLGYSLEDYLQSLDRTHRIGQKMPCEYIHLVCEKTEDTKAQKSLAEKSAVAEMAYSMMPGVDTLPEL